MGKSRVGVVELGGETQTPAHLGPLRIPRWPTSGLQRDLTALLNRIWKPQICRINSKFLNFINKAPSTCQPFLPLLPISLLQTGSAIHEGILSVALVCFFSQPHHGTWCFLCLSGPPSSVCLVSSNSLFASWLKWNLLRCFPHDVTSPLCQHITPLEQSSVQLYNLRFLYSCSLQTWSCWVVTLCSFHLFSSRT